MGKSQGATSKRTRGQHALSFDDVSLYTGFLDALLRERQISRAEFASRMGHAPAWATMVLNGQRRLQPYLADVVADVLDLGEGQRLELRARVDMSQANSVTARRHAERYLSELDEQRTAETVGDDVMEHLSRWYVGAILELARCDGYRPEPRWIASTLYPQIRPEEAKGALRLLQRLGLVDDGYQLVDGASAEAPRPLTDEVGERERESLEVAVLSFEELPSAERFVHSTVVALDEARFSALRQSLQQQCATALGKATRSCATPNRLYRVTVSAFPASLPSDTDFTSTD